VASEAAKTAAEWIMALRFTESAERDLIDIGGGVTKSLISPGRHRLIRHTRKTLQLRRCLSRL
jgi:hypothetical protein